MKKILLLIVLLCGFMTSCVKELEKEGIYESTQCTGVVMDQRSQQPVEGMRVRLTNGDMTSVVATTGKDGRFEISVDVDEYGKGYFLKVEADSLFEGRTVSLEEMQLGMRHYDLGTIYVVGPEVPLLSINEPVDLTASSVHCYGNVTDGGKSTVVERGFVYATTQYPTTADNRKIVGNGVGSFDMVIDRLAPGTTYYVRAYARNGVGVGYSDQVSFTTLNGMAAVSTNSVSNVAPTSAVCGGNVSSDGGFNVTVKGVCWSTTMQPTINNSKTRDGSGLGSFVSNITNLEPGTTYYVRAYAQNSTGVAYGEQMSFTTPNGLPVVATAEVSNIGTNTAVCGGTISEDGGFSIIPRGVCYSTTPNPTTAGPHTSDGVGVGSYVSQMAGLTTHTTYYVRAYATNSVGTVYGEEKVFVTE